MTTMVTTREWNTEEWAAVERMCESPNWHGVSPEVIARRGRPWNQDPNDVPWLDRDDAEEQIDARLKQGLLSAEDAQRMRQWAKDGYFSRERSSPRITPSSTSTRATSTTSGPPIR